MTNVPVLDIRHTLNKYAEENELPRRRTVWSESDVRKILEDRTTELSGQAKADAIENALLIKRLSDLGSEQEMHQALRAEMGNQSFARKVNFIANILNYLHDNYDYESLKARKKEAVTDLDLMKAIGESIRTGEKVPTGVCDSMHALAVRFAREMGMEAYGVSYRGLKLGHRTMVITDPNDPSRVVQLDYGSKSEKNQTSGPSSLSLGDTGLNIEIYNGKDHKVVALPSEQGAILNSVTGGKDANLSPDYRQRSQIKQAGIQTPYGTVRLFYAETPLGNKTKMGGAAYDAKVAYNDIFYGEFGVAGYASKKQSAMYGEMKIMGIYVRTTQGYKWNFLDSDRVRLVSWGEFFLRGSLYCNVAEESIYGKECVSNYDYQADLQTGLKAQYRTGEIAHESSVLIQVQSGQMNSGVPFNVPVTRFDHRIDFKVNANTRGTAEGGVTMYSLGSGTFWTYHGSAGLQSEGTGTAVNVNVNGRITKGAPIWLPSVEHDASAIIQQSIFRDNLYIGVQGRQSMDFLENRYIGLSLDGSL